MAITCYEPWTIVSQLQNEINRVFGSQLRRPGKAATGMSSMAVTPNPTK